jgi:hypothetical protein
MKKSMSMLDLFWYVCPLFFANEPVQKQFKDSLKDVESDWGYFVDLE